MPHRESFTIAFVASLLLSSPTFATVPDLQPTFRAFPIGSGPSELTARDVDGDGVMDFLAGGWQNATFLRGDSDGLFTGTVLPAGSQPRSLAAADFDEDGILDLAAADGATASVRILIGSGSSFTAGPVVSGFTGVWDIRAADFDDDGHVDVAVTNALAAGMVGVAFGNGDGTFSPPVDYGAGNAPRDIEVADLNGDGRPDIAAAGSAAGTPAITVLLGDAEGTFEPPPATITGFPCYEIVVADFNGDSVPDIMATNDQNHVLALHHGNGDGTFANPVYFPAVAEPQEIAAADVDGNGTMDVIFSNYNSASVRLMLGSGGGSFQNPILLDALSGIDAMTFADADQDGHVDLVVGGISLVAILKGDGTGAFRTAPFLPTGDRPVSVAFGLLNADAFPDLVVSHTTAANSKRLSVLPGNGNGGFGPAATFSGPPAGEMLCRDVTGDGRVDLVCANGGGVRVEVFPGNGAGGLGAAIVVPTPGSPNSLALGDLNLDGRPDIVVGSVGSFVGVILARPGGTFAPYVSYPTVTGAVAVAIGDLNGDGFPDVAATNRSSTELSLFHGDGTGALGPRTDIPGFNHPIDVEVHDFNHDGHDDVAVLDGALSILLNGGNGTLEPPARYGLGGFPLSLTFADMNGDGTLDMLTANANWNSVSVRIGDGIGRFLWHYIFGVGDNPWSVATVDLDLDGRTDLAAGSQSVAGVAVLINETVAGTSASPVAAAPRPFVVAHPNPSRGPVAIEFHLAAPGPGSLSVFDVAGRRISLEDAMLPAGPNRWIWSPGGVAAVRSGVYFYALRLPSGVATGRFVLER